MQTEDNIDYKGTDVLFLMRKAKFYNYSLVKLCLSKINSQCKNIIDFGAGIGTYSKLFRNMNYNVSCVEIDKKQFQILKDDGFKVFANINEFPDNSVSNIVSFNVMEHIIDDRKILKQIHRKLSPDGKFFIFVPAFNALFSEFDRKLGHYRRYEMNEMVQLLKECGYEIIDSNYFDSLGYLLARLYKSLKINGCINRFQIQIFDKIIFPLSLMFDKFLCHRFGKNIMVTVKKQLEH